MKVAIIGTRHINEDDFNKVLEEFKRQISSLDVKYIYSGNAIGVDQVATQMNGQYKVVHYLPWESYCYHFNQKGIMYYIKGHDDTYDELIGRLFTTFRGAKNSVKKLIRRNYFIVKDVDIVFWYTDKGVAGGTKYGVLFAEHLGIKTIEIKIKEV